MWALAEISVGGASAGGAPPFPGLAGDPFPLTAGDALPFLPGAGLYIYIYMYACKIRIL